MARALLAREVFVNEVNAGSSEQAPTVVSASDASANDAEVPSAVLCGRSAVSPRYRK